MNEVGIIVYARFLRRHAGAWIRDDVEQEAICTGLEWMQKGSVGKWIRLKMATAAHTLARDMAQPVPRHDEPLSEVGKKSARGVELPPDMTDEERAFVVARWATGGSRGVGGTGAVAKHMRISRHAVLKIQQGLRERYAFLQDK